MQCRSLHTPGTYKVKEKVSPPPRATYKPRPQAPPYGCLTLAFFSIDHLRNDLLSVHKIYNPQPRFHHEPTGAQYTIYVTKSQPRIYHARVLRIPSNQRYRPTKNFDQHSSSIDQLTVTSDQLSVTRNPTLRQPICQCKVCAYYDRAPDSALEVAS